MSLGTTVSEEFLNKLNEDICKIRSSDKMFVSADKTRNYYKITEENYNKILHDNITKTLKKGAAFITKDDRHGSQKNNKNF